MRSDILRTRRCHSWRSSKKFADAVYYKDAAPAALNPFQRFNFLTIQRTSGDHRHILFCVFDVLNFFSSIAGEVEQFQNFASEPEKFRAISLARTIESDRDGPFDPARARCHDDDPVAHVDGFVNIVRHQQHRRAACLPEAQYLILHFHPREGVQRAQRLVQQQNPRMIDQCPRQGDALGHAAGKMMRIGVGKPFKADEAHEFIHFVTLFVKHAARDQSGLDVPADGEPGKKIRVLKNQAAFGARTGDRIVADPEVRRSPERPARQSDATVSICRSRWGR